MVYEVMSFLPFKTCALELPLLSKSAHGFFNASDAGSGFWRVLCRCMAQESKLYLPPDEAGLKLLAGAHAGNPDGDCRSLLRELLTLRKHFSQDRLGRGNTELGSEHFQVATFCRFRPARKVLIDGEMSVHTNDTPVQLPLNQRVALLQQKHPKLSRADAVKMLINKGCGAAPPLSEVTNITNQEPEKNEEEVIKPVMEKSEAPGFAASVLNVTPGEFGSVMTMSPGIGIRKWSFAGVFDQAASQRDIYGRCGLRPAVGLVNGQSGALIVYGQTGSGKTHTMFGGADSSDGLVSAIAEDVLAAVDARRKAGFEVELGASYVEVFGNDITNLLGGAIGVNRGQSQRMGHKYVLEGRCEEPVPDKSSFQELLRRGNERKRKASTEMNERSTRAHTLVILRLRQRAPGATTHVESFLSLADLGGSEKVSKSKANENVCCPGGVNVGDEEVSRVTWQEYYKCRERITETNHINKGLLTLKRCVQALNERPRCAAAGRPLPRVPFNDSKLTLLLQPALSGESCTSVVVCCAPENPHAEETVQSLRFGELCSAVEHERSKDTSKEDGAAVKEALLRIDVEIRELEAAIRQKERWEWRETIRVDVVDEMDGDMVVCNEEEEMELGGRGTVEIKADDGRSQKKTMEHKVWGQVLVGAEDENARRDELIATKAKLLGEA